MHDFAWDRAAGTLAFECRVLVYEEEGRGYSGRVGVS